MVVILKPSSGLAGPTQQIEKGPTDLGEVKEVVCEKVNVHEVFVTIAT